jgi:beta-N-acetylhexosaminidase
VLAGAALARAAAALKARKQPQPIDRAKLRAELDDLMARAGALTA